MIIDAFASSLATGCRFIASAKRQLFVKIRAGVTKNVERTF